MLPRSPYFAVQPGCDEHSLTGMRAQGVAEPPHVFETEQPCCMKQPASETMLHCHAEPLHDEPPESQKHPCCELQLYESKSE